MSVVVVQVQENKIIIGSDTQESVGESSKMNFNNAKLKEINGVYLGVSGDGHFGSLLSSYIAENSMNGITTSMELIEYFKEFQDWSNEIFPPREGRLDLSLVTQFIFVINKTAWLFNDYYIRKINNGEWVAIGSGAQPAMACMELGATVEQAINATCKVDIYCSCPTKIIEIEK